MLLHRCRHRALAHGLTRSGQPGAAAEPSGHCREPPWGPPRVRKHQPRPAASCPPEPGGRRAARPAGPFSRPGTPGHPPLPPGPLPPQRRRRPAARGRRRARRGRSSPRPLSGTTAPRPPGPAQPVPWPPTPLRGGLCRPMFPGAAAHSGPDTGPGRAGAPRSPIRPVPSRPRPLPPPPARRRAGGTSRQCSAQARRRSEGHAEEAGAHAHAGARGLDVAVGSARQGLFKGNKTRNPTTLPMAAVQLISSAVGAGNTPTVVLHRGCCHHAKNPPNPSRLPRQCFKEPKWENKCPALL